MSTDGINWEQLCRNGQLVWQTVPEHREMLQRFHAFWAGSIDEGVITSKYPGFVEALEEGFPEFPKKAETLPMIKSVANVPPSSLIEDAKLKAEGKIKEPEEVIEVVETEVTVDPVVEPIKEEVVEGEISEGFLGGEVFTLDEKPKKKRKKKSSPTE